MCGTTAPTELLTPTGDTPMEPTGNGRPYADTAEPQQWLGLIPTARERGPNEPIQGSGNKVGLRDRDPDKGREDTGRSNRFPG